MRKGFVLVTVLAMMAVLASLLGAYFFLTSLEQASSRLSARQTAGFYAAEAGLNLRAEEIRRIFLDFNLPTGQPPDPQGACQGANQGSDDFRCQTFTLNGRQVRTFLLEEPDNPRQIQIPPGAAFGGLWGPEFRYTLVSEAVGPDGRLEASLRMVLGSVLLPMFQFAAFYNKDLEILPGPDMTLNGRVHTNGDLYLNAGRTLTIQGQVSTAGTLFRGRKDNSSCGGSVRVHDNGGQPQALGCGPSGRRAYGQEELAPWGGRIQVGVGQVSVPPPQALDPSPTSLYFAQADLRLALDLNAPQVRVLTLDSRLGPSVQEQGLDGVYEHQGATQFLQQQCQEAVWYTLSSQRNGGFYNHREGKWIQMLEVDLQRLLDCMHGMHQGGIPGIPALDDPSGGGLVIHLTVLGPHRQGINNYGVRVRNGARIAASNPNAPRPRGLTLVTDQAFYLQGDFNSQDWIPAAILADSLNLLSNAWRDEPQNVERPRSLGQRKATETEVNAAFLAGTDTTGGAEGPDGQDGGRYNGGLENYPRFHEDWEDNNRNQIRLTYRGSFVSLNTPRHVNGPWMYGYPHYYTAPLRNWAYDTRFSEGRLPPLTPRFVLLRQELFLREFERPQTP